MTKIEKQKEKENAKTQLLKLLPEGTTVYTTLKNRSASGMTRAISLYVTKNNEIEDITYYVARVLDYKINQKTGGTIVKGCGMDMGFHIVNNLSYALHGFPEKDINTQPRRGFTLQHRWL